jgi:hypothetical protein
MADLPPIQFRRTFKHDPPWRDNLDRVQAEGEQGFNKRFKLLEDDLDQLGRVIERIDQTFEAEESVLLAPGLIGDATDDTKEAWTHRQGYARAVPSSTKPTEGIMPLALPNRSVIASLQVITFLQQGSLTVDLARRKVINNGDLASVGAHDASEVIITVTVNQGDAGGPVFTREGNPANSSLAVVDAANFVYFLRARQTNTGLNVNQLTRIFSFRVSYGRA